MAMYLCKFIQVSWHDYYTSYQNLSFMSSYFSSPFCELPNDNSEQFSLYNSLSKFFSYLAKYSLDYTEKPRLLYLMNIVDNALSEYNSYNLNYMVENLFILDECHCNRYRAIYSKFYMETNFYIFDRKINRFCMLHFIAKNWKLDLPMRLNFAYMREYFKEEEHFQLLFTFLEIRGEIINFNNEFSYILQSVDIEDQSDCINDINKLYTFLEKKFFSRERHIWSYFIMEDRTTSQKFISKGTEFLHNNEWIPMSLLCAISHLNVPRHRFENYSEFIREVAVEPLNVIIYPTLLDSDYPWKYTSCSEYNNYKVTQWDCDYFEFHFYRNNKICSPSINPERKQLKKIRNNLSRVARISNVNKNNYLPNELIGKICNFLSADELTKASTISRQWYNYIYYESKSRIERKYKKFLPIRDRIPSEIKPRELSFIPFQNSKLPLMVYICQLKHLEEIEKESMEDGWVYSNSLYNDNWVVTKGEWSNNCFTTDTLSERYNIIDLEKIGLHAYIIDKYIVKFNVSYYFFLPFFLF